MEQHRDVSNSTTQLRVCGLCGIVAAAFLLAGDWLLLGTWTSGQEFNATWLERLAAMPSWRLTAGGLAGPIGACLYVAGFWQVYLALRPAGRALAFLCFAGFSISLACIAGAFHAAFPFIAHFALARSAAAGNVVVEESYLRAMAYFAWLYYLGAAPALIAVVLLPCLILGRRTKYPRWFALFNPVLLWLASAGFRCVPAPLGGLLVIGSGNIVFLLFFIISTAALWQGGAECRGE